MIRALPSMWMRVCVVAWMLWAGVGGADAATFVVNDTGDAADATAGNGVCATAGAVCTLRAAIQEANALAGADAITFTIGAGGLQTITPASALPTISTEIDIDGTTQPGFAGTPLIKLAGTSAPAQTVGLLIASTGADSSVRGLIIVGFQDKGIQVNANGVVVAGNYIGVTETGSAQGNGNGPVGGYGAGGVLVGLGGANTIIGGTTAVDRNVLSGNKYGVQVLCASNVRVQGNYIGLDPTGTLARPNSHAGVHVSTDTAGLGGCGNDANTNLIGGDIAGAGNVISGNVRQGILIGLRASGTLNGNRVQGNLVGLAADGTTLVPNGPAAGILVAGAFVGIGAASNTVIGGTTPLARNVLGGNGQSSIGIHVQKSSVNAEDPSGTVIQGNYVGLDQSGTLARGFTTGINVGGTGTTVGGTAAGAGNVVAGNVSHNVLIEPYATTVQGNRIGTNAAGTAAVLPSTTFGVLVKAPGTIIGGTTAAARNVISGHAYGVGLSGSQLVDVVNVAVHGNYIGTDVSGTTAVPNGHGVFIDKAGHTLGGTTPEARNIISGNVNGVYLATSITWGQVSGVSVFGNWIGLNAAGGPLGNTSFGVRIDGGVTGVAIGGVGAGQANVIAHNGSQGVFLNALGSTGVVVRGNRIDANGSLGIDIGDTLLVDTNDPLDADTGANGRQNFPVITSSTLVGGNLLEVQGTLNSTPNTNFWIDAYANTSCDPLNNGEGDVFVGGNMFLTDGSGNATFSLLVAGVAGKSVITATATGPQGTSEFSQCRTAVVPTVTISGRATLGSGPGAPPLVNVTMTLGGGASATVVTDFNGGYAFAGLATGGNYTVTPSTAGYVFAPASRPYTNVTTDQVNQDFVGSRPAISGTITRNGSALAGVTVDLTGTSSLSTTTNASGQYAFASLTAGGTFTVTPSLADFVFASPSQSFANVVVDQVANFAATRLYTISGQVRDLNDTGVANVTMTLSGSTSATQVTALDGRYSFVVGEGGTYTVTPTRGTFIFNPPSQTFANLQKDEVAPFFVAQVGEFTRYFAEGATSDFFDTRIALLNATGRAATARVRFQKTDGTEVAQVVSLDPIDRLTIDPKTLGLTSAEFSTVIESDQPIIADRTMSWDQSGYGSHAETSIGRPLTQWFLAEGATLNGFDLFYLVQNPNQVAAQIEVRYLLPAPLAPVVKTHSVAAGSRFNIWVNTQDPALVAAEMSAVVTSTNGVPVIVERAMYRAVGAQVFGAGHESAGVEAPGLQWYFAEGATGPFLDLFFLVANPNTQVAHVSARYLKPDGSVVLRSYQIPANSRFNIWVDYEGAELADTAVATTFQVTNGVGVVIERALWWGGDITQWYEGHNSAGATQTGTKWGLADGEVNAVNGAETYILIANTSLTPGTARVTLVFEDGGHVTRDFALPASSRTNVAVGVDVPEAAGKRFGAIVESVGATPAEIVVERAMFNDAGGVTWAAGSNALGTRLR